LEGFSSAIGINRGS